mmetsp:Transcript_7034/g.10743  ORF Transcript_7034/g.10743 Transcript_7034/m.10743 type:complete len:219 (-) Transcript_7034:1434-2090(-)
MRGCNLSSCFLKEICLSSVENSWCSHGKSCRMVSTINPISSRFYTNKSNPLIVFERVEHSDSVRPTSDACKNCVRKLPCLLKHLFPRFTPDDRLEITNNFWKRVRSNCRSNKIVGRSNIRHPITHGFVDRIFQCARSRINCNNFCTQHLHSENIKGLTLDICCTHIHDTFHLELCASCSCCNSMLSCSCFSNDPLFSQSFCKKCLADGVIDLMSSSMI